MKWFAAFCAFFSASAVAAELDIALTDDRVEVDTGFAGARLVLFGAVTGADDPDALDMAAVIRGPAARFTIRQMEKRSLIWKPGPSHVIENAPGLYLTYATRPIDDLAPLPLQAEHRLDARHLQIAVTEAASHLSDDASLFQRAFLSEAESLGLYRSQVGGIEFKTGALFTITAQLPANTPVGAYDVTVYLFRDGELVSADSAALSVDRVGLERRIYDFAHNQPVSYGIFCVALSLLAGWVASLAFRK